MTMCAVAKCQLSGEPRLAFCCDYLVSNDYTEHEDVSKYGVLSGGLAAVYSGPPTTADEVLRLFKKRLHGVALTDETVHPILFDAMREFRKRVSARAKMVVRVPPVELLVFGFVESCARIFYIAEKGGVVDEQDPKHAIGSGATASLATMEWRGISKTWTLDKVLYSLYEGKKMAEAGPPVGKTTMLGFLKPIKGNHLAMTLVFRDDLSLLDEAFAEFGPKGLPPEWHLPGRITGAIARVLE